MKFVRLVLYFVVGLLLGTVSVLSHAGSFQSYQGSAFRNINGTTYWKGDTGSFAQSQATVLEAVKVGGTYITVPTIAQVTGAMVAAGAGAVRMTPGLAGAALISWLASQGLELINGEWKKKVPGDVIPVSNSGAPTCSQLQPGGAEVLVKMGANINAFKLVRCQIGMTTQLVPSGWNIYSWCTASGSQYPDCGGYAHALVLQNRGSQCPSGYTYDAGSLKCVAPDHYEPAGQSDWDKVNGVTPPDDVMKEMCQALAKYNTSTPGCAMMNARTNKASAPLSDWVTNPDGTTTRKVATWTPAPTAEDPFRGDVSINEESKTTTTTTNPYTGQPETKVATTSKDVTKDSPLCVLYPNILACQEMGTAEDPAKLDKTKEVSITPDSGFGPSDGQCPQDLSYTVRLTGTTVRFSYQPVCNGLRTFRPVIIGMAWVSGVLIFLGISRKAQA